MRKKVKSIRLLRKQVADKISGKKIQYIECYSCKDELDKKEAIYIGNEVYRCKKCSVGSRRWKKFNKDSDFYKYWENTENE